MDSRQIIFRIINYILFVISFALIFWLVFLYVKNQAIDECAKASKYTTEVTAENATVSYPVIDFYNKCLEDKGIR
ncbi:MAG: hypothetical protein HY344_00715 [Candidatus Levybacteria bacterium]|nr:hypothetical protein [Candidatus Levybacteria bacterium]